MDPTTRTAECSLPDGLLEGGSIPVPWTADTIKVDLWSAPNSSKTGDKDFQIGNKKPWFAVLARFFSGFQREGVTDPGHPRSASTGHQGFQDMDTDNVFYSKPQLLN